MMFGRAGGDDLSIRKSKTQQLDSSSAYARATPENLPMARSVGSPRRRSEQCTDKNTFRFEPFLTTVFQKRQWDL